jgi:hypothetical protein
MPCYIIQCADLPMVKLGWTDGDVEFRRRYLQGGNHLKLRVIRVLDAGREVEKWMHRYFRKQRIRAEWFNLVPEMLTVTVEEMRPAPKAPPKMPAELREKIAASMRKSWESGSLRRTFDLQHPDAS